jgi:hypothetical protein
MPTGRRLSAAVHSIDTPHTRNAHTVVFIACIAPLVTFALYALVAAVVFHCRTVRRPLVFMAISFVPFLVLQSVVLWNCLRHAMPADCSGWGVLVVTYGLPCLIAALLGVAYLQFFCLMEFSISLRMLDTFLSRPDRSLSFQELRRAYPFEEVMSRKCNAAGNVGLLRTRSHEGDVVVEMSPQGIQIVRFLDRLKAFLNWSDAE